MDMVLRESTAEQDEIEKEIEKLVIRDVADPWRLIDNDAPATDIGSLLQLVSAAAVDEIDALVNELQIIRERLVIERERVRRELADYAALSRSTIQTTKLIAENLGHSDRVVDSPSIADEADERSFHENY